MRCFAALALALLVGACASQDGGVCQTKAVASVDYKLQNNQVLVPVSVDGTKVTMRVDTGLQTSSLNHATADKLGLKPDLSKPWNVITPSGSTVTWKTPVQSVAIGDHVWRDQSLLMVNGPSPENAQLGGLLGADLLSRIDVELDPASRRLTLWSVQGCRGDFVGWPEPHAVIPMETVIDGLRRIKVTVDGRQMNAILDLGAQRSIITSVAASKLGVTQDILDGDRTIPTRGMGGAQWISKRHVFPAITIGSDSFEKPALLVGEINLTGGDILLGANYLAHRHIWISYATHQLFVMPPRKPAQADKGSRT